MNDEDKKRYDETTRQMEQMYKDGMSLAKIGKEFAMTRQGIRHRFVVAEISRRKNKYQQIDRAELEKLYCRERLQISRIADFFSVSQPIIQRALIYHKIPPRNPLGKRGFMREFLKQLKPNESKDLKLQSPGKRIGGIYRAARRLGFKIKAQRQAEGTFKVTRLE